MPNSARSRKGNPYVPSYMSSQEACVVCGDAATGYHYRCMTCEGCKGFFRRTIQKSLKYVCKEGSFSCKVDKTSRNQCQQCRYLKCVEVGMAIDLVLNETQRNAKRQLISENRERRKLERIRIETEATNHMAEADRTLLHQIARGFSEAVDQDTLPALQATGRSLTIMDLLTSFVISAVPLAKQIPGFCHLSTSDQLILLKSFSMELVMLKIARQFDLSARMLVMPSGQKLIAADINDSAVYKSLLASVFEFTLAFAKLQCDECEMALMASLALVNPDRPNLTHAELVEELQDKMLCLFKRYLSDTYPGDRKRWSKLLVLVIELKAISVQQCGQLNSVPFEVVKQLYGCNSSPDH